jgi:tRNA(His) 5'-end guanylyltransferase
VPNVVAATSGSKNTGSQLRFSYIDKAISFEAKTVKEAMQKYEDKLNSIYDNTYANKLDSRASKKNQIQNYL